LSASIEPSELFKFRLSGQFQALYLTANCVGHRLGSGPRPLWDSVRPRYPNCRAARSAS